jgi:hypothetical protein
MTDAEELRSIVVMIIEDHSEVIRMSPDWIATQAMQDMKFERVTHPLVYSGCHAQLQQIAREKLRRRFDLTADDAPTQTEMFSDVIQLRYPKHHAPGENPEYVYRDYMTDDDIAFNVARMRAVGRALLKHADALELWGRERRSSEPNESA